MPEEVLQEFMVNTQMMEEAAAQAALPHGEMPGGLPGDNFIQLDFLEEGAIVEDAGPAPAIARGAIPVADTAPPVLGEGETDEGDEEDVEEVGAFISRLTVVRTEG